MKNYSAPDVGSYIASSGMEARPKLREVRKTMKSALPGAEEGIRWGVPWYKDGGPIAGFAAYKNHVGLVFWLDELQTKVRRLLAEQGYTSGKRTLQIRFDQKVPAAAIRQILKAQAKMSEVRSKGVRNKRSRASGKARVPPPAKERQAKLLTGGNPQIAKADGEAPVQAYITAMPGWKRDVGRRLDALIVRTVPSVRKAVKWNSPFYGVEGQGWFLAFHVFTRYVKVTFFQGTSLRPVPPGGTGEDARWIDIRERDLDEARMATWVQQAAALPGWLSKRPRG
jgi:hypothetical protein